MHLNPYAPPAELAPAADNRPIPLNLTEILQRSFSILFNHASTLLVFNVVIWVPLQLLLGCLDEFLLQSEYGRVKYSLTYWLDSLFLLLPVSGATAIAHAVLQGQKPTIGQALHTAIRSWPSLIGTRIVVTFITLLAFVALIVPGIYVGTRAALADQVTILERTNPVRSIERSFALTKGAFWRYFGLLAIYIAMTVCAGLLSDIPFMLEPKIHPLLPQTLTSLFVYAILSWISIALTVAYWAQIEEQVRLRSHSPLTANILPDLTDPPP